MEKCCCGKTKDGHKDSDDSFVETDIEYKPIISYPKEDKENGVIAVFTSPSSSCARRTEIHIVWANLDFDLENFDFDIAKAVTINDIVTLEYSYASVEKIGAPLTIISDRYTNDNWNTTSPHVARDVKSWDSWAKLDGHPVIYFNTRTHGFNTENKNSQIKKTVLTEYKIYKGSREQILNYFYVEKE